MNALSESKKPLDTRTYAISELAREFGVTPRALRFYEDKGLLSPDRDGMNRVYSNRDRARLTLESSLKHRFSESSTVVFFFFSGFPSPPARSPGG